MNIVVDVKLLLVASLCVFYVACSEAKPDKQYLIRYEQRMEPVIQYLASEYKKTGKYPDMLPDRYLPVLKREKYSVTYFSDNTRYDLKLGDYSKNGWEYMTDSSINYWYMDD